MYILYYCTHTLHTGVLFWTNTACLQLNNTNEKGWNKCARVEL